MRESNNDIEDSIDLYLQGRLNADELAEFEIKMLEDPHLFAQVQQAEIMHAALKAEKSQLEREVAPVKTELVLPFSAWIKQPMSIAASVLLALGLVLISSDYLPQGQLAGVQEGYALNSVVTLNQFRSESSTTVLAQGAHLLQIDVGLQMTSEEYVAELASTQGRLFVYELLPDSNGILRLLSPSYLNGPYQLTVVMKSTQEQIASYNLMFE